MDNKQKKYLRKISHKLSANFQIGKEAVNENLITALEEYLYVHEIVKVSVLQNCELTRYEVAEELEHSGFTVVEVKGSMITLFKHSNNPKKKSSIKL